MAGLDLTKSATDLGVIIAFQTLPMLLLGPYGGVIADRVNKRRLMVCCSPSWCAGPRARLLTLTHRVTFPRYAYWRWSWAEQLL